MKTTAVILMASLATACSVQSSVGHTDSKEKVMSVSVESEKVDCYGVSPMKCMVVNGELFYSEIKGFTHEHGYEYQLNIKQTQPFYENNVPADASLYEYQLLEITSKTKA